MSGFKGSGPTVMTSAGATPVTPAKPDDYEKLKEQFNIVVTDTIGRKVAAGTALAVPLVTAFCAWAQKEIGINLDPASLTAFITSMAVGISAAGFKWLSNRGEWERGAVEAYQLYLTGQSALAPTSQVVVNQPGAAAATPVSPG
jgi:hypothetical protein